MTTPQLLSVSGFALKISQKPLQKPTPYLKPLIISNMNYEIDTLGDIKKLKKQLESDYRQVIEIIDSCDYVVVTPMSASISGISFTLEFYKK